MQLPSMAKIYLYSNLLKITDVTDHCIREPSMISRGLAQKRGAPNGDHCCAEVTCLDIRQMAFYVAGSIVKEGRVIFIFRKNRLNLK